MAGQPAYRLSATQLSEKSGSGRRRQKRTQAHTRTHRDREKDARECT